MICKPPFSFVVAFMFGLVGVTQGALIEIADLNIIDDPGNPSDGLRFLDMSYSDGLSLTDALSGARAVYPNARLATPSEWDDLFAAAGISYTSGLTASDAFSVGVGATIAGGNNTGFLSIMGATAPAGELLA